MGSGVHETCISHTSVLLHSIPTLGLIQRKKNKEDEWVMKEGH